MKPVTIPNDSIAPVRYDWGAVKWVVNDTVFADSEQSFGIVYIEPGKTNPTHWHTAAQEIVHMLQGECQVTTSTGTILLRPGVTLCIPVGVEHELTNTGWEPAVYVCSFSASGRATVFADPDGSGATPLPTATGIRTRRGRGESTRASPRPSPGAVRDVGLHRSDRRTEHDYPPSTTRRGRQ
jgi:quercetin dioxygenase-like cupin family protein